MSPRIKAPRSAMHVLALLLLASIAAGQKTTPSVTPELAHRIEAVLFSNMNFAPGTTLSFGSRSPSEIPGFDRIEVRYSSPGSSVGTFSLLLSKDGTKLAEFSEFDISADPKTKFQAGDRPPRGGPANAPVLIVVYDDLECPFCARLNAELFPALLNRYKDQVRVVYRNFPIDGHPWAMHAAVDVDCLGKQSASAYWAAVDDIHSHFEDYGATQLSPAIAKNEIDAEARKQGQAFRLDAAKLNACIAAQDTKPEVASVQTGEQLGVESTPTIFINGVKVAGALPLEYFFGLIDDALRAEGATPPPPYQPEEDRPKN